MTLEVAHFGQKTSGARPVLIGLGTCNPIGVTTHQTWALHRAEMAAFVNSPFRAPSGNPLPFARVRQLDPRMLGADRVVAIATRALEQVGHVVATVPTRSRIGIALCLPERAGDARGRGRYLRRRMESTVVGPLVERGYDVTARTLTTGHASVGYALRDLGTMLESGQLEVALVLAADSHYDPFVLEELFRERRVIDEDWREGFIPGEAAACLVLARRDAASGLGAPALAELDSVGVNEEVASIDNDVGLLGLGLSRPAVAVAKRYKAEGRTLDWWYSDATGETFRVQELQLAWPRAAHIATTPEGGLELIPTRFGDVGAATMGLGVVLGIEGMRRGDPRARTCAVLGSSRSGERSVASWTATWE